jgi:hypothetical protein
VVDTLVEGSYRDGINLIDTRVVVDSIDVVSRLEATFVCLVSSG